MLVVMVLLFTLVVAIFVVHVGGGGGFVVLFGGNFSGLILNSSRGKFTVLHGMPLWLSRYMGF